MSSEHSGPAPADLVAMLLSPLLIMALVGSLIFFLLEILYAGPHGGQMQWILFFYVFGAVLAARIGMQADIAARAHLYGGTLALLAWLALQRFVEFPAHLAPFGAAVSLGLVLLAWWCVHRLTWDCTFLDGRVGASGAGVLQAAGLEAQDAPSLERYKQRKKDEEPGRTPGVWVIYFSLAALPLFGLGQALIPVEETARRRYAFWMMAIYTGSGLGLLLTTSFLGLRLYLRGRGLRMPAAMTAAWLSLGGLLTVVILAGAALLPRPLAEVSVFGGDRAGSPQRQASKANLREGAPGEGEGDADKGQPVKDKPGRDGEPNQQTGKDKPEKDTGRGQQPGKDKQKDKDGKPEKDGKDGGQGANQGQGQQSGNTPPPNSPSPSSSSWLKDLMPILRVAVFIVFGLVVLFFVLRGFLHFAANFSGLARNLLSFFQSFWQSLLGLFQRGTGKGESEATDDAERERSRPFEAFANPFAGGMANQMTLAALVCYTFAALEAWARDRQLGRQKGETALEMAGRLGEERPALEREVKRLAQLYALAVYGRGELPANTRELLERFWQLLERMTEQPVSA